MNKILGGALACSLFALLFADARAMAQDAPAASRAPQVDEPDGAVAEDQIDEDQIDEDQIDEDHDENHYTDEGTFEVGGTIGFDWTSDLFTLNAGPTVGWFVADRFELSALLRVGYQSVEQADGTRDELTTGSFVIEPSYHFPLQNEALFGQVGVGIGAGYDGEHPDFEIIPRIGLNIEVGRAGVLTPAFRVPILFGKNQGDEDDFGVKTGLSFELGITTVL